MPISLNNWDSHIAITSNVEFSQIYITDIVGYCPKDISLSITKLELFIGEIRETLKEIVTSKKSDTVDSDYSHTKCFKEKVTVSKFECKRSYLKKRGR